MNQPTGEATIRFEAALSTIETSTVLRLPEAASTKLPSRGQVAVHGTIDGVEFRTVLEPDGKAADEIQRLYVYACMNLWEMRHVA